MLNQQSLQLGRVGLKKAYFVEAENVPKQYLDVVGRVDSTTQTFERYKQLKGLGPAVQTAEGAKVAYDDFAPLFARDFAPVKFTKGMKMSIETEFTDQVGKLKSMAPHFARSFGHRRNIVAANLDNLGFTDTTYGMNSEVLYSTSHSMGTGMTGSNRPATDIAFGAIALQQAYAELRRQESARDTPQPILGQVILKVPAELEIKASQVINSITQAHTADTATSNEVRKRTSLRVIDYYTSATAWFLRSADNMEHGLFWLNQMPYDILKLPMDDELCHKWAAYESYICGWFDWHGTWASTGA